MVNRGWMPHDLKHFRYDREKPQTTFTGVLYRGDAATKYSKENVVAHDWYENANPAQMSHICQLGNPESGDFMLKAVDLDPAARTPMPDVDSPDDL